jgi:hypothetical protein
MMSSDSSLASAILVEVLVLGAVAGFLGGRCLDLALRRARTRLMWLDALMGALALVVASVVEARLRGPMAYDGQLLNLRDLVLKFPLAFGVVCCIVAVLVGRGAAHGLVAARKSGAAA